MGEAVVSQFDAKNLANIAWVFAKTGQFIHCCSLLSVPVNVLSECHLRWSSDLFLPLLQVYKYTLAFLLFVNGFDHLVLGRLAV